MSEAPQVVQLDPELERKRKLPDSDLDNELAEPEASSALGGH